jgi:hypothetical protein
MDNHNYKKLMHYWISYYLIIRQEENYGLFARTKNNKSPIINTNNLVSFILFHTLIFLSMQQSLISEVRFNQIVRSVSGDVRKSEKFLIESATRYSRKTFQRTRWGYVKE